uniref:Transmembrane protein n=1 Tax=Panagrolaimus davidi TaxID=227884 RepID=A0A914PDJ1_9BILA
MNALYFHPESIDQDPETKTSLRIYALLACGGNILLLGHMPYEETYNSKEYFDHLKQPWMIVYIVMCGVVSVISGGVWYRRYRDHKPENEKKSIVCQAIFLMFGNSFVHIGFSSIIHFILSGTSVFTIIGLFLTLLVFTALILLIIRTVFTYTDPLYMVSMMCGMDVINRAMFVIIVYHENFSCSYTDWLQFFCGGFFGTLVGLAGLLYNHGKLMNAYVSTQQNAGDERKEVDSAPLFISGTYNQAPQSEYQFH